jgi:hypothetical protein
MDENALIPSKLQILRKAVRDGLSNAVARIRAQEREWGENRYSL